MGNCDWIIHSILDVPLSFHTHGLNKYCNYELEVVLPLEPATAGNLINRIGLAIKNGLKLEDGLMVTTLFRTPIFFFKTKSLTDTNTVYRIIFPDERELYPWDIQNGYRCEVPYKSQIVFDTDKVFFMIIEDNEKSRECMKFKEGLYDFDIGLCRFEKCSDGYYLPLQYYLSKEDDLIKCGVIINERNLTSFALHTGGLYEIDFRIVCKDIDTNNKIHNKFLKWKSEVY